MPVVAMRRDAQRLQRQQTGSPDRSPQVGTLRERSVQIVVHGKVETGLVRPLVDGLKSEMVVEQPPPQGLNDRPMGFDDAMRAALSR